VAARLRKLASGDQLSDIASIILPVRALSPKSILIYSCEEVIGDGILKLSFAQQVRRRFPEAKITWLAGTGKTVYASILKPVAVRFIDEVIENAGVGDKTLQLFTKWSPLPGRKFDLIIDTQRLVARTMIVKRIPHDTFISGTANFFFSDVKPPKNFEPDPSFVGGLIDMLDLVSPRPADDGANVFDLSQEYRAAAAELLPSGAIYIGIAPGAGDRRKLWPVERYFELARKQLAIGRVPVFLLGPDEAELVAAVRREVPGALLPEWDRADDYAHVKGPMLVMALAAHMSAAIANNSGTGHMLAVGGAPLVSIFTRHDPAKYAAQARGLKILHALRDYGVDDASRIPLSAALDAIDTFVKYEEPLIS
jgi:ADP-heptose:LPS heptosyltransferase|tara:strand:+ start:79 stop:1176 length:1098 start_codon:yes stop_codon:yes gene_type:complete